MSTSRRGSISSKILSLIVLVALVLLVWVLIANWRRTGEWSFRPLDRDWWSLDTTPVATTANGTTPNLSDEAKRLAQKAEDSLWGQDGLIQKCEDWWKSKGSPTKDASGRVPSADASLSTLEEPLRQADVEFRAGLDVFKQANPSASPSASQRASAIKAARVHFLRTRELIDGNLPAYEAHAGHDAALVASAHQLRDYDQQLIEMVGEH